MSEGPLRADKTLRQTSQSSARVAPYTLIATLGDEVRSLSLGPGPATYVVGREPDVDLVLPDAAVSRHHLELQLSEALTVEDLGSSNGTVLNGAPLPARSPRPLRPGDQLELGGWLLLLQAPFRKTAGITAWPHGFFLARVDEEISRRADAVAAFVRVDVVGATADRARIALGRWLPEQALVGEYGPEALEFFLPGFGPAETSEWLTHLRDRLGQHGIDREAAAVHFPRDGSTAAELLSEASTALRGEERSDAGSRPPVVADPRMKNLYQLIERVAKSQISVILSGETGAGKEVVAETIHRRSRRADGPFVRLNCAALSENLLESELFGHEKGAFTGALTKKTGLIEAADGGTIFLDEVGEMLPAAQVKLLRVLEERQVMPVGGVSARPVDVRFVSATHRDLPARVESGDFREDLYFRLSGIVLEVPPLRERVAEIRPLAELFIETFARRDGVPRPDLSDAALAHLEAYDWPGNIRELRNAIERAVILCTSPTIGPDDIPLHRMRSKAPASDEGASWSDASTSAAVDEEGSQRLADHIQALEKNRILQALKQTGGNQSSAAEVLGISRRTLMKRMDQFNIPRPRKG